MTSHIPPLSPSTPTNHDATIFHARKIRKKQRRFMFVYLVALLIAFSPSKSLAFIAPFFVIAALIFYVQLRPNYHFQKLVLVGLIYLFAGFFYWVSLPQFWWPNYLLVRLPFHPLSFCSLIFHRSSIHA